MPKVSRSIAVLQTNRRLAVLTADPGFSAFGWGVIIIDRGIETVVEMGVIRTEKAKKKLHVLVNEDNFMRMRAIGEKLFSLIQYYEVSALTFEAFSVPIKCSKASLVKIGMPYSILSTLSVVFDLAVVMATPQAIKKSVCGANNASKEEVEKKMQTMFAQHPGVIAFQKDVAPSVQNHGWDALAAYVASEESDVMKALKKR